MSIIISELNPFTRGGARSVTEWPQLARLAGRGSVTQRAIDARQDALHAAILDALQLHDAANEYPSAAVIRTGLSGQRADGFWLRAQPIHFAAGLDRLTTVPLRGQARMSVAERDSLDADDRRSSTGHGFRVARRCRRRMAPAQRSAVASADGHAGVRRCESRRKTFCRAVAMRAACDA